MACARFLRRLGRTKSVPDTDKTPSELDKCHDLIDLTAIGVGSTLGVGIYVLAGDVAKLAAGPAVVFSFLIAALISLLSGICYSEFGARMHITGSAYTYAYVAIGEFIAFVIGWSLLAECIIGAAAVGSAWSGYLDTVFNKSISGFIIEHIGGFESPFLGPYPDFLALGISIAMTVVLIMGAKFSSRMMLIFMGLNFMVVATCVFAGLFYADIENWKKDGGFFPFGFSGIMEGAATCFSAFIGFDVIAVSSEEALNPARDIPLAIVATLAICFMTYASTSLILTLIVPYYALSSSAPLAEAFETKGAVFITYLIALGSVVALTASMLGSIFPVPRLGYAMARDGLVFEFMSIVISKTKVPLYGCLFAGGLTGIISLMLSLPQLVEMMSIGTLVAYMLVAVSVVFLRYKPSDNDRAGKSSTTSSNQSFNGEQKTDKLIRERAETLHETSTTAQSLSMNTEMKDLGKNGISEKDALVGVRKPTSDSYTTVQICTCIYGLTSFLMSEVVSLAAGISVISLWISLFVVACCLVTLVVTARIIAKQPQDQTPIPFRVPFMPYLPLISVTCDLYLMSKLTYATWIRLFAWLFCGLTIYFGYGINHSKAEYTEESSDDMDEDTKRSAEKDQ